MPEGTKNIGTKTTPSKSARNVRVVAAKRRSTSATLPTLKAGTGGVHEYVSKKIKVLRRNSILRDAFFKKISEIGMDVVCARNHVELPAVVSPGSSVDPLHSQNGVSPATKGTPKPIREHDVGGRRTSPRSPASLPQQPPRVYPKVLYFTDTKDGRLPHLVSVSESRRTHSQSAIRRRSTMLSTSEKQLANIHESIGEMLLASSPKHRADPHSSSQQRMVVQSKPEIDWRATVERSHAVSHLPHGRVVKKYHSPVAGTVGAPSSGELPPIGSRGKASAEAPLPLTPGKRSGEDSALSSPHIPRPPPPTSNVSHINFLPEYDPCRQLLYFNMRDRIVAERLGLWPTLGVDSVDYNASISANQPSPTSSINPNHVPASPTLVSPAALKAAATLLEASPQGLADSMELLDLVNFGNVMDDAVLEACEGVSEGEVFERLLERDKRLQPNVSRFTKLPQRRALDSGNVPKETFVKAPANDESASRQPSLGSYDDASTFFVSPVPTLVLNSVHKAKTTPALEKPTDGVTFLTGIDEDDNAASSTDIAGQVTSAAVAVPCTATSGTAPKAEVDEPMEGQPRHRSREITLNRIRGEHASPTLEKVLQVRDRLLVRRYDELDQLAAKKIAMESRLEEASIRKERVANAPIQARKWLVLVYIAVSGHKLKHALQQGYKERFRKIFLYVIARHWQFRAQQTAARMATLRLNNIIRRNLPRMMENFAEKRRHSRAPLIASFLRHYAHAYKFTSIVKGYMAQVRFAQRIIRKRRMSKMLIESAMRMQWERVLQEMCCTPEGKLYPIQAHLGGLQLQLCSILNLPVGQHVAGAAAAPQQDDPEGPPQSASPLMGLLHYLYDPVSRASSQVKLPSLHRGEVSGLDLSSNSTGGLDGGAPLGRGGGGSARPQNTIMPAASTPSATFEDAPPLFRIPPRLRDLVIQKAIASERQQLHADRTDAFNSYLAKLEMQEFVEGRRATVEDGPASRFEKHPILVQCALWCIEHIPGLRNSSPTGSPLRLILDRLYIEDLNRRHFLSGDLVSPSKERKLTKSAEQQIAGSFGASVTPLKSAETLLIRRWLAQLYLQAESHRCLLEAEEERLADRRERERAKLTEGLQASKKRGSQQHLLASRGSFIGAEPSSPLSDTTESHPSTSRADVSKGVALLLTPQSTPNGDFVRKQIANLVLRFVESSHASEQRDIATPSQRQSVDLSRGGGDLNLTSGRKLSSGHSGVGQRRSSSTVGAPNWIETLDRLNSQRDIKRGDSFSGNKRQNSGAPDLGSTTRPNTTTTNVGGFTYHPSIPYLPLSGRHRWRTSARQQFHHEGPDSKGSRAAANKDSRRHDNGSDHLPMLDADTPIGRVFQSVQLPRFPRRKMLAHKRNLENLILATFAALTVAFQKYLEFQCGSGRGGGGQQQNPTPPQTSNNGAAPPAKKRAPNPTFGGGCGVDEAAAPVQFQLAGSTNVFRLVQAQVEAPPLIPLPTSNLSPQQSIAPSTTQSSFPPPQGSVSMQKISAPIYQPASLLTRFMVGGKANAQYALVSPAEGTRAILAFAPEAGPHQEKTDSRDTKLTPHHPPGGGGQSLAPSQRGIIVLKGGNSVALSLTKSLLELQAGPALPDVLMNFAATIFPETCLDVSVLDLEPMVSSNHDPGSSPSANKSGQQQLLSSPSKGGLVASRAQKATGGATKTNRGGSSVAMDATSSQDLPRKGPPVVGCVTLPTQILSGHLVSATPLRPPTRARVLLSQALYSFIIALSVNDALATTSASGGRPPPASVGVVGPQGTSSAASHQKAPPSSSHQASHVDRLVSSKVAETQTLFHSLFARCPAESVGEGGPPQSKAVIRAQLIACFKAAVGDHFTGLIVNKTASSSVNGLGALLVVDSGPSVWRSFARACAFQVQAEAINAASASTLKRTNSSAMLGAQYLGATFNPTYGAARAVGGAATLTKTTTQHRGVAVSGGAWQHSVNLAPSPPRSGKSVASGRPLSRSVAAGDPLGASVSTSPSAVDFWYSTPKGHGDITLQDVIRAEVVVNKTRVPTPLTSTLYAVLLQALLGPLTSLQAPSSQITQQGNSTPNQLMGQSNMSPRSVTNNGSASPVPLASTSTFAPMVSPRSGAPTNFNNPLEESGMGSVSGFASPWEGGADSWAAGSSSSPSPRHMRSVGSAGSGRNNTLRKEAAHYAAQRSLLFAVLFHEGALSPSSVQTSSHIHKDQLLFMSGQTQQRQQTLIALRDALEASHVEVDGDSTREAQLLELPPAIAPKSPSSQAQSSKGGKLRKGSFEAAASDQRKAGQGNLPSLPPSLSQRRSTILGSGAFTTSPKLSDDTTITCPEVRGVSIPFVHQANITANNAHAPDLEASSLVPLMGGSSPQLIPSTPPITAASPIPSPPPHTNINSNTPFAHINLGSIDDVLSKSITPLLLSVLLQKEIFFPKPKSPKGTRGEMVVAASLVRSPRRDGDFHSESSDGDDIDPSIAAGPTSSPRNATITFEQVLNHPLYGAGLRIDAAYKLRLALFREAQAHYGTAMNAIASSTGTVGAAGSGGVELPQWAMQLANDDAFDRELRDISVQQELVRSIVPLSPFTLGNLEPYTGIPEEELERRDLGELGRKNGGCESDFDSEEEADGASSQESSLRGEKAPGEGSVTNRARVRGLSMYAREQETQRINEVKARRRLKRIEKTKRKIQRGLCAPQARTERNGMAAIIASGPPTSVKVLGFTSTALTPPLLFDWRFVESVVAQMI